MHTEVEAELRNIGLRLDRGRFPSVKNGGIVVPNDYAGPSSTLGMEKSNDRSKPRRPETRPWQGTAGGQGSPRGSWSARQAAPVVSTSLQAKYEDELNEVREAYPGTQVWHQEEALWLLTESALLPGLRQRAVFLTVISFAPTIVRSWGFWTDLLTAPTWIGPRHTNFPDGSVCAFEPTDGTWVIGDPIVELLDIHTLWALRHLYLRLFGRWPGYQAVRHPYERILELREDEYCGCGKSEKLYGECCREKDLARNRMADAVDFILHFSGGLRSPPNSVTRFVREQTGSPPRISELNEARSVVI